jgi:hypothetical protein
MQTTELRKEEGGKEAIKGHTHFSQYVQSVSLQQHGGLILFSHHFVVLTACHLFIPS